MADSIALRRCNRAASLHLSLSLFLSPRSLSLRSHSSRCCSHVPIFLTIFCGAQKFNRKSTHTRTRTHTHNGNISHTPPPPRMCWQPSSTLLSKPHDACPAKRRLFTFFLYRWILPHFTYITHRARLHCDCKTGFSFSFFFLRPFSCNHYTCDAIVLIPRHGVFTCRPGSSAATRSINLSTGWATFTRAPFSFITHKLI